MTSEEKYQLAIKLSRALADYLDSVGTYPIDYVRMPLAEYLVDEVLEDVIQPDRSRMEYLYNLFTGGSGTSCRTTWRHGENHGAAIECVEVPIEDLQAVLLERPTS